VIPERFGESPLADALGSLKQPGLGANQVAIGRNDRHVCRRGRMCAVLDGFMVDQDVVGGAGQVHLIQPQAGGGVSLRVEVDNEDRLAVGSQRGGEVDCRGGLSHPSLLVGDSDRPAQTMLLDNLPARSTWNNRFPCLITPAGESSMWNIWPMNGPNPDFTPQRPQRTQRDLIRLSLYT